MSERQPGLDHLKQKEAEVVPEILGRFFYNKALYGDHPDRVPHEETHKDIETLLGRAVVTCDYGGPGSKYDKENQDSFVMGSTRDGSIYLAVIDGAGGSGGGLEASITVNRDLGNTLEQGMSPVEAIQSAMNVLTSINDKKKAQIESQGRRFNFANQGIYATGVAAKVERSGRVQLAASGDSKIATIRNGDILRAGTTQMQNIPSDLIKSGDLDPQDFYIHHFKSSITGGIGIKDGASPEGQEFQGQHRDRIVLASDGLWDLVSEYEVAQLSKQCNSAGALETRLFALAYERNNLGTPYVLEHAPGVFVPVPRYPKSGDNITIAVIELDLESKNHEYLGFEGNPMVNVIYTLENSILRIEKPTDKMEKNQIKVTELNPDGSIRGKYILDKELWNQVAQKGFSRTQAPDLDVIKSLPLDRPTFKDLLDLPKETAKTPEVVKETPQVGETYTITTPGKDRMICFRIYLVGVTDTDVIFIDPTKPTEQKRPRYWWDAILNNPDTKFEKFLAPEPTPGDTYQFSGVDKNGTAYNFQLTVQKNVGADIHFIGKTGNALVRPRSFWNNLFITPGSKAIKL